MLKTPIAGSICSSLAKETSGLNHAQVTWTHNVSISVAFNAPPIVKSTLSHKLDSKRKVEWNDDKLEFNDAKINSPNKNTKKAETKGII